MIFTELKFFWFFAVAFCVYWRIATNTHRKRWLLLCSYYFYASWDYRFLSLLLISTLVDYASALNIRASESPRTRLAWVSISIATNLTILGFFKYFNFFIESAVLFSEALGFPFSASTLSILLPVGISFYTFQSMSYTIDVFRKQIEAVDIFLDFAVYVSFFPQLVAGPIVRSTIFLPQLQTARRWAMVPVRDCLTLFLIGYFKKTCVSDNIAPVADYVFQDPTRCDWLSNWIGMLFYTVQVYCDFSGYTDMALASAGLLGYELQMNFNFPYFSTSITDFWRRWHMSFSTWLRDYVYIPLGGNRQGRPRAYRNLMITMLLGGLWHGAAWGFVLWGGIHGVALIVHHQWARRVPASFREARAWAFLSLVLTFLFVAFSRIIFRAEDMDRALAMFRAVCFFESSGPRMVDARSLLILPPLLGLHYLSYRRALVPFWERLPDSAFAAIYGILWALALLFTPMNVRPFIYFQF